MSEQERPPDATLVVDNASSDGTAEMVADAFPEVHLLLLETNVGGAGGFKQGIVWAHEQGYEWLWLMDDDTIVRADTLGTLLAGAGRAPRGLPLVLASQVRWKDEHLHPMNRPLLRWRWPSELAEGVARGLLLLRYASFVSVAIHRRAIDDFGLPLDHYFIWGDDVEFTARLLRNDYGYLVPESVAYHWTPSPHPAATPTSDRFYYHARNSLLILRGSSLSGVERLDYGRFYLHTILQYVSVNRGDRRRLAILLRGIRDGLRDHTR